MGDLLSRSVVVEISNNTKNITLEDPRTYFYCGYCYSAPRPALLPGCCDSCVFANSSSFWGVAGVLVYEADSFTLAIYFSNPIDYNRYSLELGLELSACKVHLGDLEPTYTRMANGFISRACHKIESDRVVVGDSEGTARVSQGRVTVVATMSSETDTTIKVVLEEE